MTDFIYTMERKHFTASFLLILTGSILHCSILNCYHFKRFLFHVTIVTLCIKMQYFTVSPDFILVIFHRFYAFLHLKNENIPQYFLWWQILAIMQYAAFVFQRFSFSPLRFCDKVLETCSCNATQKRCCAIESQVHLELDNLSKHDWVLLYPVGN